jgi:hypothetical protein
MINIFFCMIPRHLHQDAAMSFTEVPADGDQNVAGLQKSSTASAATGHVDAFEAKFDG